MANKEYIEDYSIGVGFDLPKFTQLDKFLKDVNNKIKQNQEQIKKLKSKSDDFYNSQALRQERKHISEMSDVSKKWLAEEEARRRDIQQRWDDRKRKRARAEKDFHKMQDAHSKENLRDLKARMKAEKSIESARIKQHVKQMTQRDEMIDRMREYYQKEDAEAKKQFREGKKQAAEQEKRRRDTQKRWDARKNARLKALRKEQKAVDTVTAAIDRQVRSMKRSASYKLLEKSGNSDQFDKRISELSVMGDPRTMRQNLESLRDLNSTMRETASSHRKLMRAQIGLTTVQGGLTDSTRNMIRTYASLFALLEGTAAIKNVGMEFEGMRAAMLAATDTGEDVQDNLQFVDDLAVRLGLNLKDATRSYMKLKFAAKGKMDTDQLEDLFTSVSEFGTALRVDPEAMKGGLRALSQMLNKNQLMAEEVKSQFSEHMPGGLSIFAKAVGVTEKEFLKLMERGELTATEVFPKLTQEFYKAAHANGALEQALKSVAVQEQALITLSQKSAFKKYQSGFGEGLSELYRTLTNILKDAGPQLEKIGKIFGALFKGIAHVALLVEQPLKLMIDNIEYLTGAYMIKRIAMMGAAFRSAFLPITAATLAVEELISLTSDKLVGSIEASIGKQVNLLDMTSTGIRKNKEGEYVKSGKSESIFGPNLGDFKYGVPYALFNMIGKTESYQSAAKNMVSGIDSRVSRLSGGMSRPTTVIEKVEINAPDENVAYATWNKILAGSDVR